MLYPPELRGPVFMDGIAPSRQAFHRCLLPLGSQGTRGRREDAVPRADSSGSLGDTWW